MPIIVTAQLDDTSFETFDALRKAHFPPHLNLLSAHLTLFHSLSDKQANRISAVRLPASFCVTFKNVRFLGRGVAISVESPEMMSLRATLRSAAGGSFTRQDNQPFQPHITIQNKVEPAVARALFARMNESFASSRGTICGVQLWRYLGGPWQLVEALSMT